jgi:hypothetical protein
MNTSLEEHAMKTGLLERNIYFESLLEYFTAWTGK